ncbi:hypothetical protein EV702DRAFT_1190693 [Suillus placidus]|uniref:Uncharacterized protein n=1 Tax=Suillus placidus TaxID=48579 RepID=A0A9P7A735_9AGAM|nr:hypothetical protein EV702DRAFT_1190693 [Suillus placidus]
MSATHASTSGTPNPRDHYQPLKLSLATISCTLAMAALCVRACISQYQTEAANSIHLSSDLVEYFKAGLQWEMNTFVTPVLQYSAAHNIAHGVEDDALVLLEKLENPLSAPPTGLRWMKSRMEALLEEQDEGIQDKMAEVKMYTEMLEKLKRANGV